MKNEDEKELVMRKCYLCDKEVFLVLQVNVAGESLFMGSKGICCNCFKGGDIDQRVFLKHKNYLEEALSISEGRAEKIKEDIAELLEINKQTTK